MPVDATLERSLPSNLDAERSILGAILLDNNALNIAIEALKAEDLKASYKDGVLELTAPMPKELTPKEVKVHVEGAEPKKIEAKEKSAA